MFFFNNQNNDNIFCFYKNIGVKPDRFNQPNHGQSRTQPIGTLPYEVIATTDQYQPGQQIQGKIFLIFLNFPNR